MLVRLELDTDRLGNNIKQSLENLRTNHVDISFILKEELNQILPPYAEEIINNTCLMIVEEK